MAGTPPAGVAVGPWHGTAGRVEIEVDGRGNGRGSSLNGVPYRHKGLPEAVFLDVAMGGMIPKRESKRH